jgi:secretion/DNA translocation related TadE-like protein
MNGDRGSASVWLLAVGLVVVSVGLGAVEVGVALTDRHRAQVAADLGALAGARYAKDGASTACARAEEVVGANGAKLVACQLDGLDLMVTTQVGPARATARAGPVRADAAGLVTSGALARSTGSSNHPDRVSALDRACNG